MKEVLSQDMTDFIINECTSMFVEDPNGAFKPWWMENPNGVFKMSSAFQILREREKEEFLWSNILCARVPFKINSLLWRCWKSINPTEDNLKRMRVNIASRRCCREEYDQETMSHLFLKLP